jgi:hypothetical protein
LDGANVAKVKEQQVRWLVNIANTWLETWVHNTVL